MRWNQCRQDDQDQDHQYGGRNSAFTPPPKLAPTYCQSVQRQQHYVGKSQEGETDPDTALRPIAHLGHQSRRRKPGERQHCLNQDQTGQGHSVSSSIVHSLTSATQFVRFAIRASSALACQHPRPEHNALRVRTYCPLSEVVPPVCHALQARAAGPSRAQHHRLGPAPITAAYSSPLLLPVCYCRTARRRSLPFGLRNAS
jgi:hypothetical protein